MNHDQTELPWNTMPYIVDLNNLRNIINKRHKKISIINSQKSIIKICTNYEQDVFINTRIPYVYPDTKSLLYCAKIRNDDYQKNILTIPNYISCIQPFTQHLAIIRTCNFILYGIKSDNDKDRIYKALFVRPRPYRFTSNNMNDLFMPKDMCCDTRGNFIIYQYNGRFIVLDIHAKQMLSFEQTRKNQNLLYSHMTYHTVFNQLILTSQNELLFYDYRLSKPFLSKSVLCDNSSSQYFVKRNVSVCPTFPYHIMVSNINSILVYDLRKPTHLYNTLYNPCFTNHQLHACDNQYLYTFNEEHSNQLFIYSP